MTLTYKSGWNIQGLSTDTKPTTNLPAGYKFFETDTKSTYTWDGTTWALSYLNYLGGKDGWFQPNSSGAAAAVGGMWLGLSVAITTGIQTGSAVSYDSTDGVSWNYIAGATINSQHGLRVNTHTERDFAPQIEFKVKLGQTTNSRVFMGWRGASAAPAVGADPTPSLNGVLFGFDSGVDGNWHIYQNNGSATSDSTTIPNVAAADTSTHYFGLRATGSTFQYSYARGTWTNISTAIPSGTSLLGTYWWIENLDANVRNFKVYYAKQRQIM
jgi:hypothetical protein